MPAKYYPRVRISIWDVLSGLMCDRIMCVCDISMIRFVIIDLKSNFFLHWNAHAAQKIVKNDWIFYDFLFFMIDICMANVNVIEWDIYDCFVTKISRIHSFYCGYRTIIKLQWSHNFWTIKWFTYVGSVDCWQGNE